MGQRSSHLVAYATVVAASNNIPAAGTWYALPLFDPNGVSIASGVLPGQVTRVQFSGTGFNLGVDISATPTWQMVCQAQPEALDVALGGGKKVAVTSQTAAAISTGTFQIHFFA